MHYPIYKEFILHWLAEIDQHKGHFTHFWIFFIHFCNESISSAKPILKIKPPLKKQKKNKIKKKKKNQGETYRLISAVKCKEKTLKTIDMQTICPNNFFYKISISNRVFADDRNSPLSLLT